MKFIYCLSIALLLTACATRYSVDETDIFSASSVSVSSSSSESSESSSEPEEATLAGVIEPIGITIYQQGTHKITQDDGTIVLLESSAVDLNGYVGEFVEVSGAVRATVEADGQIMLVETIELQEQSSDSSDSSDSSEDSSEDSSSDASVSSDSSSSEDSSETSTSSSTSAELNPKVEAMLQADLGASNWTQEYCSRQVPYCFPIHRNWWYTAFGATTNEIMRVDIGPEEITTIGEGVIIVRLIDGETNSASGTAGGSAYAYANFDGQHFEVSAPAELQAAVTYIANNITVTE